jgi:hypothetical protein
MTFCPEWLTGSPSLDTSNALFLWVYLVVSFLLRLLDATRINLFFCAAVHEHHVCPSESSYFVSSAVLTAGVHLAGSSSPCGSCMTRTHTSRLLCARRRPVRRARQNDVLDTTPYGPHHDYHRLLLYLHTAMEYL